jgi:transcriptional regulator with XRE-family HTH domain
MATCETRLNRGRRRGRDLSAALLNDIRAARTAANVSVRHIARALGWSHSRYARFESGQLESVEVRDVAEAGAVLGLELSARLYPVGDPIRDAGQQKLRGRLRALIAPAFRVVNEVLLPNPGDRRSWDVLLRLGAQLVGVELETRVRDVQRLVRQLRERERDGGVDHLLLVLSDSAHNRHLLPQLMEALGPGFATPPRSLLRALRTGQALPGSGVILI